MIDLLEKIKNKNQCSIINKIMNEIRVTKVYHKKKEKLNGNINIFNI